MAIKVTEKFSVKRFSKEPPWTAYREFDVDGVGTRESAALAAIDAVDPAIKIPQLNDGHPDNPTRLKCKGPKVASRPGPQHFCIGANYEIPPTGSFGDDHDDPLLKPVEVTWELIETFEAVDVDLDYRAIVAANGEPIEGCQRPCVFHRITLVKNFPFINPALLAYSNSTNKFGFTLLGGPTVDVQQGRVACVLPAATYRTGAAYYPIKAVLECIFDASLGAYPFQHRVMNKGTYGFCSDNKGVFVGADGRTPISNFVKLAANGTPMAVDGNSLLKVLKADGTTGTPTANPGTSWSNASPAGSGTNGTVLSQLVTSDATIGWFKKTRVIDIGALLALFT